MKGINITELMDKCLLFFRCHNYSDDRINRYKALWKKGILKFMAEENIQLYTSDIGFRFKAQCIPKEHFNDYIKDILRSVNVLDAMLQQGSIPKRCTVPIEHPLNFPIGDKMASSEIRSDGRSRGDRAELPVYRAGCVSLKNLKSKI